jgi:hypothetical protein
MPKLTSGLTQKERLEVLQSIEMLKTDNNKHEKKIIQIYREWIARECSAVQMPS